MALILCDECGEKISDTSETCIHCGYHFNKDKDCMICKINGKSYDFSNLLDEFLKIRTTEDFSSSRGKFVKLTGCADFNRFYDIVEKTKQIPEEYDGETIQEVAQRVQTSQANKPKCPTCGSTNITKIGTGERVASIVGFGLLSKKINKTFKCNNCKYSW